MNKKRTKPRILIFDLETLPNQGYFWNIFDDRGLPLAFVVNPKTVATIAYKWLGDSKSKVLVASQPYDDKSILEAFARVWEEADYVVGHYGDGFDIPYISGRMFANRLPPLPTVPSIDTYKLAKKHFGRTLNSNKLDHLATILGIGNKNKTSAELWVRCAQGDKKAWKEMAAYNVQDVVLLEKVLTALLPYVNTKLNMNLFKDVEELVCNTCASTNLQKRGTRVTKLRKYQRYHCQDCGSWMEGKHEQEKEAKDSKSKKSNRKTSD